MSDNASATDNIICSGTNGTNATRNTKVSSSAEMGPVVDTSTQVGHNMNGTTIMSGRGVGQDLADSTARPSKRHHDELDNITSPSSDSRPPKRYRLDLINLTQNEENKTSLSPLSMPSTARPTKRLHDELDNDTTADADDSRPPKRYRLDLINRTQSKESNSSFEPLAGPSTTRPHKRLHDELDTKAAPEVDSRPPKRYRLDLINKRRGTFDFFTLPGEVRNRIYGHLTAAVAAETTTTPIPFKKCTIRLKAIYHAFAGLGSSNRRLRLEFWPLLWSSLSYRLCDCHNHTRTRASHRLRHDRHRRHAIGLGKVMPAFPPMLTGPVELGCGRVKELIYGEGDGRMHGLYSRSVLMVAQLVAVLTKLEVVGTVRTSSVGHVVKMWKETVRKIEKCMRDVRTGSFEEAVQHVCEKQEWRPDGGYLWHWVVDGALEVDYGGFGEDKRFKGLVVPHATKQR